LVVGDTTTDPEVLAIFRQNKESRRASSSRTPISILFPGLSPRVQSNIRDIGSGLATALPFKREEGRFVPRPPEEFLQTRLLTDVGERLKRPPREIPGALAEFAFPTISQAVQQRSFAPITQDPVFAALEAIPGIGGLRAARAIVPRKSVTGRVLSPTKSGLKAVDANVPEFVPNAITSEVAKFSPQITVRDATVLGRKNPSAQAARLFNKRFPIESKRAEALQDVGYISPSGVPVGKKYIDASRNFSDLGDVSSGAFSNLDVDRAAIAVEGNNIGFIRKKITEPVREALVTSAEKSSALKIDIQKRTGISAGSSESRLLQELGESGNAITNPKLRSANKLYRQTYDTLLDQWNEKRARVGLEPVPKRTNYFRHVHELNAVQRIFGESISNLPAEVIASQEFINPRSPFYGAALKRLGFEGFKLDAAGGLEGYIDNIVRINEILDPIAEARAHIKFLPGNSQRYFNSWINEGILNKATPIDRFSGKTTGKVLNFLRRVTGKGTIMGNFSTILLQPSSIGLTFQELGPRFTLDGHFNFRTPSGNAFAYRYSRVLKERIPEVDFNPSNFSKVDKVVNYPMLLFDREMVGGAYMGAFKKATSELNLPFRDALLYADDVAARTQAAYSKSSLPPLLRSQVAGAFLQFQTFANNAGNIIARDIIGGTRKGILPPHKAVGQGTKLIVAGVTINYLYGLFGLRNPYDFETFVPGMSFVKNALGLETSGGRFGTPAAIRLALSPIFAAQLLFGDERIKKQAAKDLERIASTAVKGGNQMRKSFKGFKAIQRGGHFSSNGNLLFPITSADEKVRAVMFGPFGTKAGQAYLKKRNF